MSTICSLGEHTIAPALTMQLDVAIASSAAAGVNTFSGTAVCDSTDPVAGSDTFNFVYTVNLVTDLVVSNSGTTTVVAGNAFSYVVTLDNSVGPSDTNSVIATISLPGGEQTPSARACHVIKPAHSRRVQGLLMVATQAVHPTRLVVWARSLVAPPTP